MAKKAPFFPFYAADWLDSERIFSMGLECEGAYIRLLSAMWKRQGFVPDNLNWCCNLLRCKPAKWKKIRAVLVDELGVVLAGDKGLFNRRLNEELKLFEQKSEKNKQNAEQLWKKKNQTDPKKPNEINKTGYATAKRPLCHTDTDTELETERDKTIHPTFFPSRSQIEVFQNENQLDLDGFYKFYSNNDWHVGIGDKKKPIENWKGLAVSWSEKKRATSKAGLSPHEQFSEESLKDTSWRHNLGY